MSASLQSLVALIACALGVSLAAPVVCAQSVGPRYYTVVNGDTLWDIAHRHRVTSQELIERNHLASPAAIRRGMRLHLPSRAVVVAAPTPAVPPARAPNAAPAAANARVASAPISALGRPPAPTTSERRPGGRWGRASRPGVVHFARLHDSADITVDLRRVGPRTLGQMRAFLRAGSGATHSIDARLVRQLGIISDHFGGRTLEVISGYRVRRRGQWTAHSRHNVGHAVDFRVQGVPNRVVRDFCRTFRATGCGYYPRSVFIHMDTRDESAQWVDWSRPGERPRYGAESRPPAEHHPAQSAAHADAPDTSVPPVGAENPELDDAADDTPSIRTEQPAPDHDEDAVPSVAAE